MAKEYIQLLNVIGYSNSVSAQTDSLVKYSSLSHQQFFSQS